MSEIICDLSFTAWLISLSIMFPTSIHTVTKGNIFFFFKASSIPLCKCPIVVLSTHLSMDFFGRLTLFSFKSCLNVTLCVMPPRNFQSLPTTHFPFLFLHLLIYKVLIYILSKLFILEQV